MSQDAAQPRPDLVPVDLPDFYRDDLPVSRGGWEHIARLFCALTPNVEVPTSRLEATKLITRLRDELTKRPVPAELPRGDPEW